MASTTPRSDPAPGGEVCVNERVGREQAATLRVRDAMVATPKTVPATATVADLRGLFSNSHVKTALLVDGPRFSGVVQRAQVDDQLADDMPARALATRDVPTVDPESPLADALAILDRGNDYRLVVLDPGGEDLRGLLCLTGDRSGFCQS